MYPLCGSILYQTFTYILHTHAQEREGREMERERERERERSVMLISARLSLTFVPCPPTQEKKLKKIVRNILFQDLECFFAEL